MKVMKVRSRMISVRLSEEEYSALVNLCVSNGARSVSDVARDAMRMLLRRDKNKNNSHSEVNGIDAQIRSLNQRIEELKDRLAGSRIDQRVRKSRNVSGR